MALPAGAGGTIRSFHTTRLHDERHLPARGERLHPPDRGCPRRGRPLRRDRDALPPGAQRVPPHRARQGHLPRLRHRPGVRGPLPSPLRRHEPGDGGHGVRGGHPARHPLARLRLGRAPVLRLRLLRAHVRVRAGADPEGTRLRRLADRGADPRGRGNRHRRRASRARTGTGPWRRTSISSSACVPGSSPTAPTCCARRSTWPRPT